MDRGYGFQPFPRGGIIERVGDHGGGWPDGLSWAILALLLLLLVITIASLALDAYRRSQQAASVAAPVAGTLALLDARYARGEVDRETYLQTRADLSGAEAPTAVMPAQPDEAAAKPEG
jgi:putative membrane protein